MRLKITFAILASAVLLALPAAHAQAAAGGQGDQFERYLRAQTPAGGNMPLSSEFEDLECPACAHASPIVHAAVERYKIPFERHDFPLPQHLWSRDAAIIARYLQDKVSPAPSPRSIAAMSLPTRCRFPARKTCKTSRAAGSARIISRCPSSWTPPDASPPRCRQTRPWGERIGLQHTPSIFVIAPHGWTQVVDVSQLV